MAWTTLTMQVTTPLFNGGADLGEDIRQDEAGIRVASLRGAMRFWFRALAGTVAGPDLRLLAELERYVFGDAGNPSPVQIRIPKQPGIERTRTPYFLNDREENGEEAKWIAYLLGQGLTKWARERRRFELTRHYVDAGQSFDIKLRFPAGDAGALALAAIRLCCLYGGLGARTRRGFGGVQVVDAQGPLPDPWTPASLKSNGLRDYVGTRVLWPSQKLWPSQELGSCRDVLVKLRHKLAPGAETFDDNWDERPPYPVLSRSRTQAGVSGGDGFGNWHHTLRQAGCELRHFRANRVNTRPDARYDPKIKTREWAEVVHRQDARHFPLGALGLPVVYKDNYIVNVDRGTGPNAEKLRRASPLWLRAVGSGDHWRLLSFAFFTQFLPEPDVASVHLWRGTQGKQLDVGDADVESLARQWIMELRTGHSFAGSDPGHPCRP